MTLYRDEAVVLRTQKLGEADRIVTMLTREHGRIRGVAKGVRRTKSKFGARLEPGSYVDIQLYVGKTFDTVTQVEAIMNYGEMISHDYQRWTIASAILETAERFTSQEEQPAPQEFALVVGGLKALAEGRYDSSMILDAFLLRSLAIGGYAPSMSTCSRCEKPGPHRYFSLVGGGSVCVDCRPSASATPAPETLELMDALLTMNWEKASASEGKHQREASGLIAAYLQWHLERGLRSLPLVERR
ncbi:MAG: DNA repair protein RecO [Actinobacteria bacterium]|uniref:DNA repair protein RecO n=1 Tax=freshwater metagenome TaxID=449393 RepID=A0A6J7DVC1_9ZZZZ|nr:DNA repair protein RecO [Actinomycetota bacterium]MSW47721.1 DNA repair protein RecO [Actinomycetota bacterium]MSX25240.1 DNA repair protein RecO [Actinomycetota bacterium]MSY46925.1 DNA repair protein RecO [Actinomycetota bacterium]MSY57629.1 DNA repair protein RecO [Actinomycetota bacterium]